MALPTIIVSSAAVRGFQPPCIATDGDVWSIIATNSTSIDAYKATDPTSSWTLTDGTNNPTFTSIEVLSLVQDGDNIHIVTYDSGSYEYHLFDASAETWSIANEAIETPADAPTFPWCSVAVRSDGDVIMAYAGDTDQVMGGKKERVDYARREASSWTVGVAVDGAGDIHYGSSVLTIGATSDRMHIGWWQQSAVADPPTAWDDWQGRTLDATNGLSTTVTQTRASPLVGQCVSNAISYDDTGTVYISFCTSDLQTESGLSNFTTTEDGSGNIQTVNSDFITGGGIGGFSNSSPASVIGSLAGEGTDTYSLFSGGDIASSEQDIYYNTSVSGGMAWGSPSEEMDAVTCNMIYAKVYVRSGDTVLAFIYDDAGVQKYNEKVLSAGTPDLSPTGIASDEVFGTSVIGRGAVDVSPSGVASLEAFGNPVVADMQSITVNGIASEEAFGTTSFTVGAVDVTPAGIASDEAFGATTLTTAYSILASGIAGEEAFGASVLTTTIGLTPTGIASLEAFGATTVAVGAVDLAPNGIASLEAFGTTVVANAATDPARVTQSSLEVLYQPAKPDARNTQSVIEVLYHEVTTLLPSGIDSAEAFGTTTITSGAVNLAPSGIASAELFGATTLSTTYDILANGIVSLEAFGGALVAVEQVLLPNGITSAEAFGGAVLSLTLTANGIASAEVFGNATLSLNFQPVGVASAEAFGSLTVSVGGVNIAPSGIASDETFGVAIVASDDKFINAAGIASDEAFGGATITSVYDIATTGITSDELFGSASLGYLILPSGIISLEAIGDAAVTTGVVDIAPSSIASEEAFGASTISYSVVAVGIASEEAFGGSVVTATVDLSPTGLVSDEAFGGALVQADITITVAGIPSEEAFGTALVQKVGVLEIFAAGIASEESFGALRLGQILAPDGIPSGELVWYPIITPPWYLVPGIASEEAFGTAVLSGGVAGFNYIPSEEAFGVPRIGASYAASSIDDGNLFGTPLVQTGVVGLSSSSIAGEETFGNAEIFSAFSLQNIAVDGILSSESFGESTAQYSQLVLAAGVVSEEAVGEPTLVDFNPHTATAWKLLPNPTTWDLEHRTVEFVLNQKESIWVIAKRKYE